MLVSGRKQRAATAPAGDDDENGREALPRPAVGCAVLHWRDSPE
jgi:hypothetical protein